VIHRAAAEGFARSADAYERGRPRYPDEAVALFASRVPAGGTVLDLAAGTGVLTRALVAAGLDLVAVEPVAEMRAVLPASVRALDGTAEAIPLPDGCVAAVAVGQAFHWFEPEAAPAEIHRVLRADGILALFWNVRVLEDPVHAAIDDLIGPYRGEVPSHRTGRWREGLERSPLFGPLEERAFDNTHDIDADGLAARVGSTSFIAALPEAERSGVLDRVRALAGEGTVTLPYRTEVQICRRR
jgi:SAM-dependent methyltransferase